MTAVSRKQPDSVPVGPYMGNHGAQVAGVKLGDYYTSGRVMAEAQTRAWEIYQQDIVVAQSDGYYIAEGFGTIADYHEDSMPSIRKHVISDAHDICKLKVPDPYKDGRMPVYLEATQLLARRFAGDVCIRATGTGPFSLASHLWGIDRLLSELLDAEYGDDQAAQNNIFQLMELTTRALIAFAEAELAMGANIVQCGDSLASLDIISPEIYRKYVFPFEKMFFDQIKPSLDRYRAASLLHICGNNRPILKIMAETGADIIEIDYKVDLAWCKSNIGDKVCLMGNLNPAGNLLAGTPESVALEAGECIRKAGANGGFILGTGCEAAIFTPPENMKSMIRTARASKYPLQHKAAE